MLVVSLSYFWKIIFFQQFVCYVCSKNIAKISSPMALKGVKPQSFQSLHPLDPTRALRQASGPHPLYTPLTFVCWFINNMEFLATPLMSLPTCRTYMNWPKKNKKKNYHCVPVTLILSHGESRLLYLEVEAPNKITLNMFLIVALTSSANIRKKMMRFWFIHSAYTTRMLQPIWIQDT